MGITDYFFELGAKFFFERPVQNKTISILITELENSLKAVQNRATMATDNQANREQLRHIIGIERWGQQRLRVALGESLVMDEYERYQPPTELALLGLRAEFDATRQETIRLAQDLGQAGADALRIPHNQFGAMTIKAWLHYLNSHASRESKRLKK